MNCKRVSNLLAMMLAVCAWSWTSSIAIAGPGVRLTPVPPPANTGLSYPPGTVVDTANGVITLVEGVATPIWLEFRWVDVNRTIDTYQVTFDQSTLSSSDAGGTALTKSNTTLCVMNSDCEAVLGTGSKCFGAVCDYAFFEPARPDGHYGINACSQISAACGGVKLPGFPGFEFQSDDYSGTLVLEADSGAKGNYTLEVLSTAATFLVTPFDGDVPVEEFLPAIISFVTPPTADTCDAAIPVAVPGNAIGTTAGATVDSDAPLQCGDALITSPGVWYSIVGTGTTITASLCSPATTYDSKLSVYCRDCGSGLTCVDGDDDFCGFAAASEVSWCSQPGAAYLILVHGFSGDSGPFELEVSEDGSTCPDPVECFPAGACCQGARCSIQTERDCADAGGTYLGDDSLCSAGAGTPMVYEEAVNIEIPDDGGPGNAVIRTLTVPDSFTVGDVNVDLIVTHTFVGDLIVTLEHGGVTATIFDRPGVPILSGAGCKRKNLDIILDDEGLGGPIEDQCADDLMSPPNYRPNDLLEVFDGMNAAGDWILTISDNEALDIGTLDHWSLHIDLPGNNPCAGACCLPNECIVVAEDECRTLGGRYQGNETLCRDIECDPRVSSTEKGSVLIYSKIEIKWDDNGNVIQDTFLDITNDYPQDVTVQGYFINGDTEIEQILNDTGGIMQGFEPGWNTADCRFELTANQPHYWSAANGSVKCQPFNVLDSDGPGRVDPEAADGSRILRGYAIFWATKFDTAKNVWRPVHWNHLKGDAVLVNYANGTAWEYNAWAFQANSRTGQALPSACDTGVDPITNDDWVLCDANNQSAWISSPSAAGGVYHPQLICEELGYESFGQSGGNCADECGRCEEGTNCQNTGQRIFDNIGEPVSDSHGVVISATVMWECLNFELPSVHHGDFVRANGSLRLDGLEYDAPYASLLLDFYASGSTVLSGSNQSVMVDTDLTLHAVSADLRQDGCGPVLTKVEAQIWNEFESKFSGTRRCICCWDQTMLSDWVRSVAVPNHFTRSQLRTDKGKARLDGVGSLECDYEALCGPTAFQKRWSNCVDTIDPNVAGNVIGFFDGSEDAAILGLATKFLAFSPSGDMDTAGMNLVGAGTEAALIVFDPMAGPEELRDTQRSPAQGLDTKGSSSRNNLARE